MHSLDDEIFFRCSLINNYLNDGNEHSARNELIKLLDFHQQNKIYPYSELVNHLIRQVGLFPYMTEESSDWKDALAYEMFKVDVGCDQPVTLHLQQSFLLKKLLSGANIAVSAPTSFGKSFVIDAFISLKKPKNVVLIVPTIALMDETRRRIYKKFANHYEIITTTDVDPQEKNIFIFPQERAFPFVEKIKDIDILIIDEFYKASADFDKDRAITLLKCISAFSPKAKQKYFLAPNISELLPSPFTEGVEFVPLDFNTVFLETKNYYPQIKQNPLKKDSFLTEIINENPGKTLIYAGTYVEIDNLKTFFLDKKTEPPKRFLLESFSEWLKKNYNAQWYLPKLIQRGIGIHNGRLHRSLAQIQVNLFNKKDGIDYLISTSSIIEGVNTAAENVVIWKNSNGGPRLNYFTYKNIIGRSGRMFKHFIGKVFLLDQTPEESKTQLNLKIPQDAVIDKDTFKEINLSSNEMNEIELSSQELEEHIGSEIFNSIHDDISSFDIKRNPFKELIKRMYERKYISGISGLNSSRPRDWEKPLEDLLFLQRAHYKFPYKTIAQFIIICSSNWEKPLSEIINQLETLDIGIDDFFELEKNITYNFANFLNIFNKLQKKIFDKPVDILPFITKITNAFLPAVVLQLEEFGLPRMLAQKIQAGSLIDFNDTKLTTKEAIKIFKQIGKKQIKELETMDPFDSFIIDYFYDGISC